MKYQVDNLEFHIEDIGLGYYKRYSRKDNGFVGTVFDPLALDKNWYSINEPLYLPYSTSEIKSVKSLVGCINYYNLKDYS